MNIQYKVVKQTFGYDPEKTNRYVVKSVTGQRVPFDQVCLQLAQICGIHRCMATLIVGTLLDVLVNSIEMGHSVQLGEFGILRPALRAKARDNEWEVTSKTIYRRRVVFIPGKMLRDFMKNIPVTRFAVADVD